MLSIQGSKIVVRLLVFLTLGFTAACGGSSVAYGNGTDNSSGNNGGNVIGTGGITIENMDMQEVSYGDIYFMYWY